LGLPDFIVIGAQRSGTTWLYNILKSNRSVKLASGRKEVHFFDRYFYRRIGWYKQLFPEYFNGVKGEITPAYLYHDKCAERIKDNLPDIKLICILRNPIERAYSGYKYLVQEKNYQKSFEDSIKQFPDILKRGLYYQQLKRYYNIFRKEQIKIIIYENVISKPELSINNICDFLGISRSYEKSTINKKYNISMIPKYPLFYKIVKSIVRKMYDYDFINIINYFKNMEIKRIFFTEDSINGKGFKPINERTRKELINYYIRDVKNLEKVIDVDIAKKWGMKNIK